METSPQREDQPLISSNHNASNKNSSYKRTLAFTIVAVFIVVTIALILNSKEIYGINATSYNAKDAKNEDKDETAHNKITNYGKINKKIKEIDWAFDPAILDEVEGAVLPDKDYITVKVSVLDPGHLEGTYKWDGVSQTTFKFDALKRYIQFSQKNEKTNEVFEFYSEEDTLSKKHIYRFNSDEFDATDKDEVLKHFAKLYSSQLAADLVMSSVKLGSKGLIGGSSGGVQMLHNFAMHLYRTLQVKDLLPSTFDTNRILANSYISEIDDTTTTTTENSRVFTSSVDISQQWCFFWCDGNAVDGDPSYCYEQGHCKTEIKCDNDCFGLCGEGCDCWSWVCGDCACHCLCENHDYYCSCLSMEEIECWGFWEFIWEDCD